MSGPRREATREGPVSVTPMVLGRVALVGPLVVAECMPAVITYYQAAAEGGIAVTSRCADYALMIGRAA